MAEKRVKVLMAKLGLDVHSRGAITVSSMLRDAGMEVIYIGNAVPQEIINTAIQEDVDVVGVSSLGGAHLTLGKDITDLAKSQKLQDHMVFLMGGVHPPRDEAPLKEMGFDDVFGPGATQAQIVSSIKRDLAVKAG